MWKDIKFLLTSGIPGKARNRLCWMLVCIAFAVRCIMRFSVNPELGAIGTLGFLAGAFLLFYSAKGFMNENVVPHWGKAFGRDKIKDLLTDEEFRPYVLRDGRTCDQVEISKSKKWIRCKGFYYPVALVRGYRSQGYGSKGNLYMIDGTVLYDEVPGDFKTSTAFEELFPPMFEADAALDNKNLIEGNKAAFMAVWKGSEKELAAADWGEIRYQWEKKFAELYNKQLSDKDKKRRMKVVSDKFNIHKLMFGRVLDDEELGVIRLQIERYQLGESLARITRLENYSDDYCVCNGIRLLGMMEYPDNAKGIDFLFDCIRDVRKPYCNDAVEVLKQYPRDLLIEHIEHDFKYAYSSNDVVWGAGLLILAKEIDYEVALAGKLAEIKAAEQNAKDEANGFSTAVVEDENGISEFQVLTQGGAQMAQEFKKKE